jgi:hypothetical protein
MSRSRIFHLYGGVTITDEGLQDLGLCSALRAFEQGGISCETGPQFLQSHQKDRPIQSPLTVHKLKGTWKTYYNLDPQRSVILSEVLEFTSFLKNNWRS